MKVILSFFVIGLVVALSGCGGGGSSSRPVPPSPPAPPAPVDITLLGAIIDGPVSGGHIYLFAADTVQAALDTADAAEDRAASLNDAGALAEIEQADDSEGAFAIDVSGDLANMAVFIVFDNAGAVDETFGDTPFNMESVLVLGDEGTTSTINITPHTTVVAQQVRQSLPLDAQGVADTIATAQEDLMSAFGEDQVGIEIIPEGIDLLTTTDTELLESASMVLASLVRSTATLTGLDREAILEALALDALDGDLDGDIPVAVDQAIADAAAAANDVHSLGEGDTSDIVIGSCASVATLLKRACDIDVMDDYLEEVGLCQDGVEDELGECIADLEEQRSETIEECDAVFVARTGLCSDLDDAVHEPEFGAAFAGNFVDPTDIGVGVDPNPYFPLVTGNEWVYEATFIDEDSNEMVTETTTVTVMEATKLIQGIDCVVVKDVVEEDGNVIEDTDDWFAQDLDGNVWYCGEIAQDFEYFENDMPEEAELVSIDGSWKAGREGAKAGILVPAVPQVGDVFRNEVLYGDAEDVVEVLDLNGDEAVAVADCEGACLVLEETTPLEPDAEEMTFYKPGVGVILEIDVETGDRTELISFGEGGG